jgi:predicted RecA/RadA family phage recombinase
MARNYISPGNIVTIPAPANVDSGGVVVAGAIVGVAQGAATSGQPVDVALKGIYRLPKVSANVFSLGEVVFWNAADSLVTDDAASGANPRIGVAVAAAGNGAGSANVRLG